MKLGLLLTLLISTKNSSLHAINPPFPNTGEGEGVSVGYCTQQGHPLPSPLSEAMYRATFFPANDNETLNHPQNQRLFKVATQTA